jgi:mannosyltransferase
LEISGTASGQIEESAANRVTLEGPRSRRAAAHYAIYAIALAVSIALWLVAIRAPLWLDETSSYWQISAGFRQIMARRGLVSAAYPYILWLATRITGTSEIALRSPSILAMLGAVYLLYRAAREIFDRDVALIAVVIFCIHPIVAFAAIDARPYAFGALAMNAAIYSLVRLRHSESGWLAAAFGATAALSTHFQLLFGAVLPVLAISFLVAKAGNVKTLVRQSVIAFCAFTLVFLPVVPDLIQIFRYRQAYVFDKTAPSLVELASTLAPGWLVFTLPGIVLLAIVSKKLDMRGQLDGWSFSVCASLGLIPILILYGVSALTPTNIFVARYRLIAIPGIALWWGWLISRIDSSFLRVLFCVAVVSTAAYKKLSSPDARQHSYTWKYALELAEKNAAPDGAPVLMCSDFPSADYFPMPMGEAVKDSGFFTPLSYYKLSVPVVGLPRALNDEAMRIGSEFVREAAERHERFLAMGFRPSLETMRWLKKIAAPTHEVRALGQPDGILVLEFTPR